MKIDFPEGTTEKQKATVEDIVRRVISSDFHAADYEFKRLEVVRPEPIMEYVCKSVFLLTEVGLVGDEGTMACIFARDRRHFMVGPRGGIRVYSKRAERFIWVSWVKLMSYMQ